MQCKVKWAGEGMLFHAVTQSGHVVNMDVSPEGGGNNYAARPMEMILIGAGGCASFDVILILQRGRHQVTNCEVVVDGERATTDPKVFTKVDFNFKVTGVNLPEAAVIQAVKLSHEKYCSAAAMLAKTAHVEFNVEIINLPSTS